MTTKVWLALIVVGLGLIYYGSFYEPASSDTRVQSTKTQKTPPPSPPEPKKEPIAELPQSLIELGVPFDNATVLDSSVHPLGRSYMVRVEHKTEASVEELSSIYKHRFKDAGFKVVPKEEGAKMTLRPGTLRKGDLLRINENFQRDRESISFSTSNLRSKKGRIETIFFGWSERDYSKLFGLESPEEPQPVEVPKRLKAMGIPFDPESEVTSKAQYSANSFFVRITHPPDVSAHDLFLSYKIAFEFNGYELSVETPTGDGGYFLSDFFSLYITVDKDNTEEETLLVSIEGHPRRNGDS